MARAAVAASVPDDVVLASDPRASQADATLFVDAEAERRIVLTFRRHDAPRTRTLEAPGADGDDDTVRAIVNGVVEITGPLQRAPAATDTHAAEDTTNTEAPAPSSTPPNASPDARPDADAAALDRARASSRFHVPLWTGTHALVGFGYQQETPRLPLFGRGTHVSFVYGADAGLLAPGGGSRLFTSPNAGFALRFARDRLWTSLTVGAVLATESGARETLRFGWQATEAFGAFVAAGALETSDDAHDRRFALAPEASLGVVVF